MMMLSEIAKAVNGQMLGADIEVFSVGSDSRNIVKNQLFVAIKGEKFDGNTYVAEAIKEGAAAVLVSNSQIEARPVVLVSDTRLALGTLAQHWRNKFTLPLVAVTGSNGKTTVKEMIAAILSVSNKNVLATQGNLNNDIGMPMTLLKIRKEHAYAVIEMGMSHLQEIDYLTRIAQPTVAVINNAGTAHIGELGSRENIAKAKSEIFAGLHDDGVAVINADDEFADYWKSLNQGRKVITFGLSQPADVSATYQTIGNLTRVSLKTPNGKVDFNLAILGVHNIQNALAASAVAVALGVEIIDIAKGLTGFGAVKGRLNWLAGFNGAVLIDDTYNANPDSMKAAIDVLANQNSNPLTSTIFVMGDMGELGENAPQMHTDIGAYAKQKKINQLFTFGELSQLAAKEYGASAQHFSSIEVLVEAIKNKMKQSVTVLVKGSRFMQMERVVHQLLEKNIERENT